MLIAQLTDCHVVAEGETMADRIDPGPAVARAVEVIRRHAVDLVVGTGDLVNDGTAQQYDRLEALLAPLADRFVALPGNHDDRTELRRRWPALPAGGPDDPLDHVIEDRPVRIVLVDTTIPGQHDGRFTADQAAWLDGVLAAAPTRPTLVFQHHPPFVTGIVWMDTMCGFTGGELEAEVVARHPQVLGIHAGHLHRGIHRRFGSTVASCWPSTTVQLDLRFTAGPAVYSDEPGAVVLHRFEPPDAVNSHLVTLAESSTWTPTWADD